jgi:hypothetical protein
MHKTSCLTESDFEKLIEFGELPADQQEHLNECSRCKALGDQLAEFDPSVSARRVLDRKRSSLLSQPLVAGSLLVSAVVLLFATVVEHGYASSRAKSAAFAESAAADATSKILAREDLAVLLRDKISNLAIAPSQQNEIQDLLKGLLPRTADVEGAAASVSAPVALRIGDQRLEIKAQDQQAGSSGTSEKLVNMSIPETWSFVECVASPMREHPSGTKGLVQVKLTSGGH